MRYLILSDIHANWQALDAVLKDARGRYGEIVCLGDLVGYGADPNRVTSWVREHVPQVVRGNHDKACCGLEDPVLFNPVARRAAEWTLEELSDDNREYLRELPRGPLEADGFLMVHGSIVNEDEYVLSPDDAALQFSFLGGRRVFFGHTHVQGGFLYSRGQVGVEALLVDPGRRFLESREGRAELINPGSVGQPRDRNWTAAYALYDSETRTVEFRRCPYDLAAAQQSIREAGLPDILAERLAFGR